MDIDILQFPSCKLYANGKFRLPNQIKSELQKSRYLRVVIVALADHKCQIIPVSIWKKISQTFPVINGLKYPLRAQSLDKTYLTLYPELIVYLNDPDVLYIGNIADQYMLMSKDCYQKENIKQKALLDELYEQF